MKKVKLEFNKMTTSEQLMIRYLQTGKVDELIINGKSYKLKELEIIE